MVVAFNFRLLLPDELQPTIDFELGTMMPHKEREESIPSIQSGRAQARAADFRRLDGFPPATGSSQPFWRRMSQSLIKSIAVWGISKGLRLPQAPLDRVNELSFLRDLLLQLRIDCVLDVGANRGQFARELRGIGYDGPIISFEPIGSEFLALKEQFKNDPKWSGYQVALGSREESMSITIPRLTVMSSLLESTVAERGARKESVKVRRLDNMLPSLMKDFDSSRVFLKMDTQGYDLEVFRGTSGCIDKIQGIQSELSIQALYKNMPHYLEVLEAYEAAGFDLYNLSVVNRVSNGGLLELNCFMRRAR